MAENMTEFIEWLNLEINNRDWSLREFARRSKLSSGYVSQVLNYKRRPGNEFCIGVGRALHLPAEDIFRKAGLLPPKPGETEHLTLKEIWSILSQMDDEQLREVRNYARYVKSSDRRTKHAPEASDKTPDGLEPAKQ